MPKKVIDIFPPKEKSAVFSTEEIKISRKEKEPFGDSAVEETVKEKKEKPRRPKVSMAKLSPIFGLVLLLAVVFGFSFFAKAKINIFPKTENMTFSTKLTVDKAQETVDLNALAIPGQIFEKEKTITDNFVSTGKISKEQKATGTVTVYNAYSTAAQSFIVNTRFVSVDGKTFRTPVKVTVPGGTYSGGKLIAGELTIQVVADQPGSEYNIGPSTFSIPGFAGTEKYTKFFAKSSAAMTGGSSDNALQVTKTDLENAKNAVSEKAKTESENALKADLAGQAPSFYYVEDAIATDISETFTLARAGDQIDNFNYQAKAVSETMLFKKDDVMNFAESFVLPKIPQGKKLFKDGLTVTFSSETVNLNSGKITVSLEVSAKVYSDIDASLMSSVARGKSVLEVKTLLEDQPEIDTVDIRITPFWSRKIPEDLKRIELKVIEDSVAEN